MYFKIHAETPRASRGAARDERAGLAGDVGGDGVAGGGGVAGGDKGGGWAGTQQPVQSHPACTIASHVSRL